MMQSPHRSGERLTLTLNLSHLRADSRNHSFLRIRIPNRKGLLLTPAMRTAVTRARKMEAVLGCVTLQWLCASYYTCWRRSAARPQHVTSSHEHLSITLVHARDTCYCVAAQVAWGQQADSLRRKKDLQPTGLEGSPLFPPFLFSRSVLDGMCD